MKTLPEVLSILRGSKQFDFEYGNHGCTVLVITNYYTGEKVRLDLGNITEEMLDELQVELNEENDSY